MALKFFKFEDGTNCSDSFGDNPFFRYPLPIRVVSPMTLGFSEEKIPIVSKIVTVGNNTILMNIQKVSKNPDHRVGMD